MNIYYGLYNLIDSLMIEIINAYVGGPLKNKLLSAHTMDPIYDFYKISHTDFTYMCFFGLCKDWILSREPHRSYASFLRDKFPSENLSSEMNSNPLYQKRKRYFKKVSELHKVPMTEFTTCNKDRFENFEFLFKYKFNTKTNDNKESADEEKSIRYINNRPFQKDIFAYMYPYEFTKDHNYRWFEFKSDLEKIKIMYDDVKKNSVSYFQRCVRYNLIEHLLHFETAYKFSIHLESLSKNITLKEKIGLLFWESNLRNIKNPDMGLIEFPVFTNSQNFINMFFDEYFDNKNGLNISTRPTSVALILAQLSTVYNSSIVILLNKYKDRFCSMSDFDIGKCSFSENIFKNYIGRGQHIISQKNLTETIVKDLLEIYSPSDTIEERLKFYNL